MRSIAITWKNILLPDNIPIALDMTGHNENLDPHGPF